MTFEWGKTDGLFTRRVGKTLPSLFPAPVKGEVEEGGKRVKGNGTFAFKYIFHYYRRKTYSAEWCSEFEFKILFEKFETDE